MVVALACSASCAYVRDDHAVAAWRSWYHHPQNIQTLSLYWCLKSLDAAAAKPTDAAGAVEGHRAAAEERLPSCAAVRAARRQRVAPVSFALHPPSSHAIAAQTQSQKLATWSPPCARTAWLARVPNHVRHHTPRGSQPCAHRL